MNTKISDWEEKNEQECTSEVQNSTLKKFPSLFRAKMSGLRNGHFVYFMNLGTDHTDERCCLHTHRFLIREIRVIRA